MTKLEKDNTRNYGQVYWGSFLQKVNFYLARRWGEIVGQRGHLR